MANCGILLNDGVSFLLLNTGDFYLLNDNSCLTEPGGGVTPFTGTADDRHTYRVHRREAYLVPFRDAYLVPTRDPEDGS